MPPEQGGEGGTGDSGSAPAASQQQGSPDGGQGTAPDGAAPPASDDSAAVIARLNAEAKQHRQRAEAAEAKLKAAEEQGLSEVEKLQRRVADEESRRIEAENRVQEVTLSGAVRAAAVKAKAVDPDLIWRVIDINAVETDSDGQPVNLDKLVGDAKKAHPVLFERVAGSGDGGPSGESAPTGDMNELIRRGVRRAPV